MSKRNLVILFVLLTAVATLFAAGKSESGEIQTLIIASSNAPDSLMSKMGERIEKNINDGTYEEAEKRRQGKMLNDEESKEKDNISVEEGKGENETGKISTIIGITVGLGMILGIIVFIGLKRNKWIWDRINVEILNCMRRLNIKDIDKG